MPGSTMAGVITATATVITALGGFILAVAVLIPVLRASRAAEINSAKTIVEVAKVHTIVNQQRTDSQRYQKALVEALQEAGIKVPRDQSIEVAPATLRIPMSIVTDPPVAATDVTAELPAVVPEGKP